MVFDGIVFAIIVALLRGGSINRFAYLKIRAALVFPLLLSFQIIIYFTQNKIPYIGMFSNLSFMIVYVIGLYFLWLNRELPGFIVIFIGVLLNFLVMGINGGRMPVSIEASQILDPFYVEALKNGLYGKHTAITEATKLTFLGDIIPIGYPYPRTQVISIGDIIMNIGAFIFIQHVMVAQKKLIPTKQVTPNA
mgnify:CR=1 FL=1